jgi:hypothetical protein
MTSDQKGNPGEVQNDMSKETERKEQPNSIERQQRSKESDQDERNWVTDTFSYRPRYSAYFANLLL